MGFKFASNLLFSPDSRLARNATTLPRALPLAPAPGAAEPSFDWKNWGQRSDWKNKLDKTYNMKNQGFQPGTMLKSHGSESNYQPWKPRFLEVKHTIHYNPMVTYCRFRNPLIVLLSGSISNSAHNSGLSCQDSSLLHGFGQTIVTITTMIIMMW